MSRLLAQLQREGEEHERLLREEKEAKERARETKRFEQIYTWWLKQGRQKAISIIRDENLIPSRPSTIPAAEGNGVVWKSDGILFRCLFDPGGTPNIRVWLGLRHDGHPNQPGWYIVSNRTQLASYAMSYEIIY